MSPRPITIFGNLTDAPELHTAGQQPRANFTVAQNHRRFNRDTQEWEDAGADFYACTAWGALAEAVAQSLGKGAPVLVLGTIRSNKVTNQDTGETRTYWNVNVDQVGQRIIPARGAGNQQQGGFGNQRQQGGVFGGNQQQGGGFGGNQQQGGWPAQQGGGFGDMGEPPF